MKHYFAPALLLTLLSSACATADPSPAQARYLAFEEALSDQQKQSVYKEYLSARIMSFHEQAESEHALNSYRQQGAFPLWLEDEESFHERSIESGRCLTVSGTTFDGEPGFVVVRYTMESGRLKADDIHYEYPNTREDFPSEAVCPDEITLSFPSEDGAG